MGELQAYQPLHAKLISFQEDVNKLFRQRRYNIINKFKLVNSQEVNNDIQYKPGQSIDHV